MTYSLSVWATLGITFNNNKSVFFSKNAGFFSNLFLVLKFRVQGLGFRVLVFFIRVQGLEKNPVWWEKNSVWMHFIGAPVFLWIFSAWTGMGDEVSNTTMCPTTRCTTCWCPKAQLSDPDAVFPFRNTEEVRDKIAEEHRRLLHWDGFRWNTARSLQS